MWQLLYSNLTTTHCSQMLFTPLILQSIVGLLTCGDYSRCGIYTVNEANGTCSSSYPECIRHMRIHMHARTHTDAHECIVISTYWYTDSQLCRSFLGESLPVTKTPVPRDGSKYSPDDCKRHTLFNGTEIIQTRFFGGVKVLAVVIRTGMYLYGISVCLHI